jgi:subtilisin family serine protease
MKSQTINNLRAVGALTVCALSALCAEPEHVPGRLLAGLRPRTDPAGLARTLAGRRALIRRHSPALGVATLDVPEEASGAILESLRQSGLFDFVEPDYYGHTAGQPDDPSYNAQWHLPRIGAPLAWSLTTGSDSIVVAVIDSGVYSRHPDLASKLVPGWNFVKDSADTSDVMGHGTAVAGTVAAATNNGIGVAGVNWRSRIMPLVAVDEKDFSAYSDIAAAIEYAANHGVRVINVSIGGRNSSHTLQRAVDYAWSKGALVFASAMNQGVGEPYYPAACIDAIAVSATDSNDRLASFSNFGGWITLSAPGTGILSTADGGGYSYWNGTSFASPIAAGVAALILAVNPRLTNAEVLAILQQTAELPANSPSASKLGSSPDSYFGWGRVNAYRAVLAALPARLRSGLDFPARRKPR